MEDRTCSTPGCTRPWRTRGYCANCYERAHRTGQLPTLSKPTAEQRFLASVQILDNGCWRWTAGTFWDGYGQFSVDSRKYRTHRYAYELYVGPIGMGLDLDHVCHNEDTSCPGGDTCLHRRCVNPAHLEPVSHRENMLRGRGLSALNAIKTHCPQGHPYDEANTYMPSRGGRTCRTCHRNREHMRKLAKREAANASA